MPDNRIDPQAYSEEQMLELVHTALQPFLKQWITQAQIVHATGLSVWQVEDALRVWMDRYPSRLDVNEKGELLYWFDWSRTRLEAQPLGKRIAEGIRFSLVFLFKLWILGMVFTYGLFYLGLLAILVAVLSKSPQAFLAIFYGLYVGVKEFFQGIVHYIKTGGKTSFEYSQGNIIHLVFAHIFGDQQPNDRLVIEKRVLDYLRHHRYLLSLSDLILITGWRREQADEELTRLISHYRGEPKVSEEGVIYVEFPEIQTLIVENKEEADTRWDRHYCWQNLLPTEDPRTGDDKFRFFLIRFILILTLVISTIQAFFANPAMPNFYQLSIYSFFPDEETFISFWSSYFSLGFAFLALSVSMLNKTRRYLRYRHNRQENIRRQVHLFLFKNMPLIAETAIPYNEKEILPDLRIDLHGEPTVLADGTKAQQFEEFYKGWKTTAVLRGEERPAEIDYRNLYSAQAEGTGKIVVKTALSLGFVAGCTGFGFYPLLFGPPFFTAYECERVYDYAHSPDLTKLELYNPPDDACYPELFDDLMQQKWTALESVYLSEHGRLLRSEQLLHVAQTPSLRRIELRGNCLALLPLPEALAESKVEEWIVEKAEWTSVPAAFLHSPRLQRLSLAYNPLRDVAGDWERATGLKELNLYQCSSIADYSPLQKAPALEHLLVTGCTAEQFRQLCGIKTLKRLRIENADLDELPTEISQLTSLEVLEIKVNGLKEWKALPEALAQHPTLSELRLEGIRNFRALKQDSRIYINDNSLRFNF